MYLHTTTDGEEEGEKGKKKGGKREEGEARHCCEKKREEAPLSVVFAGVTLVFHVLPGGSPAELQSSSQLPKKKKKNQLNEIKTHRLDGFRKREGNKAFLRMHSARLAD